MGAAEIAAGQRQARIAVTPPRVVEEAIGVAAAATPPHPAAVGAVIPPRPAEVVAAVTPLHPVVEAVVGAATLPRVVEAEVVAVAAGAADDLSSSLAYGQSPWHLDSRPTATALFFVLGFAA